MAEEKELTLEDLGLKNETPAESVAKTKVVGNVKTENGDNIQIIKPDIDVSKIENEWKPEEMTYTDKDNKVAVTHDRKIIRPDINKNKVRNERNAGYQRVSINSFAKTPVGAKKKEENPIRKTLDGLYELASEERIDSISLDYLKQYEVFGMDVIDVFTENPDYTFSAKNFFDSYNKEKNQKDSDEVQPKKLTKLPFFKR